MAAVILPFGCVREVVVLPRFVSEPEKGEENDLGRGSWIRSSPSALNCFFDKHLSLIVGPSTRASAIGEHSPMDH